MPDKQKREQLIRVPLKIFAMQSAPLIVLLIGMLIITIFLGTEGARILTLLFSTLLLVLLVYAYFSIKIVVTPERIRYQRNELTITSKWKDIDTIATRSVWGFWTDKAEGLLLSVPSTVVSNWMYSTDKLRRQTDALLREQRDFIPLSMWFGANWRETEVGAAIRQYAPQLLDPSIKLPEVEVVSHEPLTLKALFSGEIDSGAYRIDIVERSNLEPMAQEHSFQLLILDGKTIHHEFEFFDQIKTLLQPLTFSTDWLELERTLALLPGIHATGVILLYRDFQIFMEENRREFDIAVDVLETAARRAAKLKSGSPPLYILFESQTKAGLSVDWL